MPHVPPDPADALPSTASTNWLFGSGKFFRLWIAQVVSSLGDWIGFIAVTALAARVGGSSPEAAIGLVLSARLIPGFFFGTIAGVLVDRWDRKRVMVVCDIGRGLTLATLPFVNSLAGLFFASLLLEIFTLVWSPAKDASVPNMVPQDQLATANSMSLVAAYGTFPIGSAVFALLAKVAQWLGGYDALHSLRLGHQETLAIWVDVATFFVSALIISTLALPKRAPRETKEAGLDIGRTLAELREGLSFIRSSPVVRSVMLGLATGLIGGGMLVPLGPVFSKDVLGGGSAGFGLLLTALGTGVALGIAVVSFIQGRIPLHRAFVMAVLGAGVAIIVGGAMSTLTPAVLAVFVLGLCAGGVYVLGYTILQTDVDDQLRGRIFAVLYTLVRFCLLLAFAIAPVLSSLLDSFSNSMFGRRISVAGVRIALPGVRLTLWFGGSIIIGAGLLAVLALRTPDSATPATGFGHAGGSARADA